MKKTISIYVILLVIVLGLSALFLLNKEKEVLDFWFKGEDRYEAHAAFFGDIKVGQTFISPNDNLSSIGVMVVNLRKKENNNPIIFHLKTDRQSSDDLARAERSASDVIDDQYLIFSFPKISEAKGKTFYFYLESPQSTKENALGARKELDGAVYPEGSLYYRDKEENNDAAFAVFHKDRLCKIFVQQIIKDYILLTQYWLFMLSIFSLAFLFTICFVFFEKIKNEKRLRYFLIFLTVFFIVLQIALSFWGAFKVKGHSGGDPYNYLFIGKRLLSFQNPFIGDKRLPFYPLLLTPGLLLSHLIDPLWWERGVGIIFGGIILLIWYFLARRFKIPPPLFILTLIVLVFNKEFFWLTFQAWPFTTYAALLLLATLFFYDFQKPWRPLFLGIVLGAAGMTRQESYPAILLILILVFLYYRKTLNLKKISALIIPLVIAALPLLISNIIHFGNPFYSYYFEQGRMETVDSWQTFKERFGVIWGVIGGFYYNKWKINFRVFLDLSFYLLFFAMLFLAFKKYWLGRFTFLRLNKIISFSALFLFILVFFLTFHYVLNEKLDHLDLFNKIFVAAIFVGIIRFCWDYKKQALPLLLICLSQMLVVFWFFPYTKYMVPALQFLVFFLALGLFYVFMVNWKLPFWGKTLNVFVASFIILSSLLISFKSYPSFAHRYNQEVMRNYFAHEAVKFIRTLKEEEAAYDEIYLPALLFLSEREIRHNSGQGQSNEEMWQWLERHKPHYFMVSNASPIHELINDPKFKDRFQLLKSWEGKDKRGKEIKIKIYEVKYGQ